MRYHIVSIHELSGSVVNVVLAPLKNDFITFQAGQYVELVCQDGTRLPYSIANIIQPNHHIELFIKQQPSDPKNRMLFNILLQNDSIDVEGPHGECVYHYHSNKPVLLIAGGTGMAQIKSLLECALVNDDPRHFYLYWGIKKRNECFLETALFEKWASQLPFFKYQFIPSSAGYVQDAIIADHVDLSAFTAYLSGSWTMVDGVFDSLTSFGLSRFNTFSDRFAFSDIDSIQ